MENIVISSKSDFVKINITNSSNDSVAFERKFSKGIKILEFKKTLEIVTGGNSATMELDLFSGDKFITKINNNDAMLGSYPIEDGMRVHVTDNFLFLTENVEKFELTDQQYSEKQDTLKNFLLKNKLGKYDEEEMKKIEEKKRLAAEEDRKYAELATVGSRCEVAVKGNPKRLGTIMYNGPLDGKKGIFIGVQFDEPLGVNDGSINGHQYFDCPPKYGSFVVPSAVTVGDFPAEVYDLDEEI